MVLGLPWWGYGEWIGVGSGGIGYPEDSKLWEDLREEQQHIENNCFGILTIGPVTPTTPLAYDGKGDFCRPSS